MEDCPAVSSGGHFDGLHAPLPGGCRAAAPLARRLTVDGEPADLVGDLRVEPAGDPHALVCAVHAGRELAAAAGAEGPPVVDDLGARGDLRQAQAQLVDATGAVGLGHLLRAAGRQVEVRALRFGPGVDALGVGDAEVAEPVDDVGRRVRGVEGPHACRVGELPVVDVVEVRVVLHRHAHRLAVRHRHLDDRAAGVVVGVGDQRPRERRSDLAVHDVLEGRVEHRLAVEFDLDVADRRHVTVGLVREPHRGDLARTRAVGDHAAFFALAQARVGAVEPVVVAPGPVVAGELPALLGSAQLREAGGIAVGVPADGSLRRGGILRLPVRAVRTAGVDQDHRRRQGGHAEVGSGLPRQPSAGATVELSSAAF